MTRTRGPLLLLSPIVVVAALFSAAAAVVDVSSSSSSSSAAGVVVVVVGEDDNSDADNSHDFFDERRSRRRRLRETSTSGSVADGSSSGGTAPSSCDGAYQRESYVFRNLPLLVPNGTESDPAALDIPTNNQGNVNGVPCRGRGMDDVCWGSVGVGSGMSLLGCDGGGGDPGGGGGGIGGCVFVAVTDCGPRRNCRDIVEGGEGDGGDASSASSRGFVVPHFSPTITTFRLDDETGDAIVIKRDHLRDSDGNPVSGISNTAGRNYVPYDSECKNRIEYDPSGLDPEDIVPVTGPPDASDGGRSMEYYVLVEEYGPSFVFVERDTLRVAARFTPRGVTLDGNAKYPVYDILPESLGGSSSQIGSRRHRRNTGFEGVACSTAPGDYVCWGFVQSPYEPTSYVHRVVELDYGDGIGEGTKVTAEYVWEGTITPTNSYGLDVSDVYRYWTNAENQPKDLKVSAAFYVKERSVVVLERAKNQVLYWLLNLTNATNVLTRDDEDDLEHYLSDFVPYNIETTAVNTLAENGIVPAAKALVLNSSAARGWDLRSRQEGFVIVGDGTVLVTIDDNDFGMELNDRTRVGVVEIDGGCNPFAADEIADDDKSLGVKSSGFAVGRGWFGSDRTGSVFRVVFHVYVLFVYSAWLC